MKRITGVIISLTISALLVVTLFIPTVTNVRVDATEGWQYDDYNLISGAVSASGALELLNVGSVEYVHAKDVGEGSITYSDGHTDTVDVKKAQIDVVMMYGQSNAAYRNPVPSQASPIPKLGTAYYYGLSDRAGALSSENSTGMNLQNCTMYDMINSDTGELRIGDKGPAFAATYYASTHTKVYWINCAIGGQPISTFMPNAWGWNYAETVLQNAISELDEEYFEVFFQGYMWIQGEGNATTPVSAYKSSFLTMHSAILNGELGYRFNVCILSKVREVNAPNPSIAEIDLAEENATIIMATEIADTFTVANGLIGSDELHYSQMGNNLIGTALGESMAEYAHYSSPLVSSSIASLLQIIPLVILAGLVISAVVIITHNRD